MLTIMTLAFQCCPLDWRKLICSRIKKHQLLCHSNHVKAAIWFIGWPWRESMILALQSSQMIFLSHWGTCIWRCGRIYAVPYQMVASLIKDTWYTFVCLRKSLRRINLVELKLVTFFCIFLTWSNHHDAGRKLFNAVWLGTTGVSFIY